jgi:hypothetical protein
MKDSSNIQLNSYKPLFSDLFKLKETENMNSEVKNIYNIQQDLMERDKKKNNIIIYGKTMKLIIMLIKLKLKIYVKK